MKLRTWTLLLLVFLLFSAVGFLLGAPDTAEAVGCIGNPNYRASGDQCIYSPGNICYECYYGHNDGSVEYCVENADGSYKNCAFFEDMRSAP